MNANTEAQADFTLRDKIDVNMKTIVDDMPREAAGLMALR